MMQSQESSKLLHNDELVKQKPVEVNEQEEESFCYAMQLANFVVISMAMYTVVELSVFDIIHRDGPGKRLSAADIASELSCKNAEAPSALDRLLWLLASHSVLHYSVVVHEENCGLRCFQWLYSLTPVAKFFARNADDAILEGGVAFNRVHGSHAFEYMRLNTRFNDVFNGAMLNQTALVMNKILESYKGFDNNITGLVDVGGGLGVTLNLITSKYPHIQAINFDLPRVIQNAPPYPRVEHVAGDTFESVPKGDAILMKWILHDWDDERCLKLLKKCYNAIPEDGKVIVIDSVFSVKPDTSAATKSTSQLDLLMMTQTPGGKERD